jgi:hypothetical protein
MDLPLSITQPFRGFRLGSPEPDAVARKSRYRRAISAVQLTTTVVVGSVRFAVGVNRMNVWSSDVTA